MNSRQNPSNETRNNQATLKHHQVEWQATPYRKVLSSTELQVRYCMAHLFVIEAPHDCGYLDGGEAFGYNHGGCAKVKADGIDALGAKWGIKRVSPKTTKKEMTAAEVYEKYGDCMVVFRGRCDAVEVVAGGVHYTIHSESNNEPRRVLGVMKQRSRSRLAIRKIKRKFE